MRTQPSDGTFTDERGVVWSRPTAWAYAQVCKALEECKAERNQLRVKLSEGELEIANLLGVIQSVNAACKRRDGRLQDAIDALQRIENALIRSWNGYPDPERHQVDGMDNRVVAAGWAREVLKKLEAWKPK
jgi:hypothetical protein